MGKNVKGARVLSIFELIIGVACIIVGGYFLITMISAATGTGSASDALGYTLGLLLFIYFGIPTLIIGAAMITSAVLLLVETKRGKYLKMRPYFITYTVLYFVFAAAASVMAILAKETATTLLWAWIAFIFILFAVLKLKHAIAIKKLRESEKCANEQAAEIYAEPDAASKSETNKNN